MTKRRSAPILTRVVPFAPWASLVVLLGLSSALPNRAQFDERAEVRKREIAAAIEAVPHLIGPWTGVEAPVPPEAQELLRPNAIFSRTYVRPGSPRMHVLLVHCGDARDMIGHYPPVCYPKSGWQYETHKGAVGYDELHVDGRTLPVSVYRFRRIRDQGAEESIQIFNAFVLPDGTVTPSIDDINRQSERLTVSVQGVAQLQVITADRVERGDALDAAGEILAGMADLLTTLGVGQGEDRD